MLDRRQLDRKRAVDKDRHARNAAFLEKLVEMIEQLLRPLHRERRDHQRPSGVDGRFDRALELFLSLVDILMHAVAVRRLDDAIIDRRVNEFRRLDDRRREISEVAGKNNRFALGLIFMIADPRMCPASKIVTVNGPTTVFS